MNVSEIISIDKVISRLELSEYPIQQAYVIIAEYVNRRNFDLYFDVPVRGATFNEGPGKSAIHLGRKKAFVVNANDFDEKLEFFVHEYIYENAFYFPTNSLATSPSIKEIPALQVYCDSEQIEAFAKKTRVRKAKGDQNLLKALALLARDLADNGPSKFSKNCQVNASGFKKHVLGLAERYEISDQGLRGLDDKLNDALAHHDLKDLENKNPS